jgi:hypothetical protein
MILEFVVIILSLIGALVSFFAIITDLQHAIGINWRAVGGFIFFVLLILFIIKPTGEKTPAQIKASWKYKDYQAVYDYLDTHKPNLSYEKEDRESLAILLFFDWTITDDSNPDALVLTRITNTSNDTQIFQPKNKKSL